MSKAHEKMGTAPTTEALLERLVDSIKTITQHQDVAVHCFDKQWNSRVVARNDNRQTFNYSPDSDEVSFSLSHESKEILETHKVQVQLGANQETASLVGRPDEAPPSAESVLLRVMPVMSDFPMLTYDQEDLQSRIMVPLHVSGKLWGVLICHQSPSLIGVYVASLRTRQLQDWKRCQAHGFWRLAGLSLLVQVQARVLQLPFQLLKTC
jgi:GAF domain-containing protein